MILREERIWFNLWRQLHKLVYMCIYALALMYAQNGTTGQIPLLLAHCSYFSDLNLFSISLLLALLLKIIKTKKLIVNILLLLFTFYFTEIFSLHVYVRVSLLNSGFPLWLHLIPGIELRTDNELFKVYKFILFFFFFVYCFINFIIHS